MNVRRPRLRAVAIRGQTSPRGGGGYQTLYLPSLHAGTSFHSGAITNGFNTIDSGLYDNALISGQADGGVKSAQYDVTVKSGQYQTTLQSSQFGGSLASGQFDSGIKSAQYGGSLKSGQYDTGARSGHYDLSYKSAQYGSSGGVRAGGQYDSLDGVLPAFTWSAATLPSSSSATVVAGNTSTYAYQAGTNNAAGGSSPVILTAPSSLSGEQSASGKPLCVCVSAYSFNYASLVSSLRFPEQPGSDLWRRAHHQRSQRER